MLRHIVTISYLFHWNKTKENKKLVNAIRNHCKRVKSNYADTTHHCIGSQDFWRISNSNLTEISLQFHLCLTCKLTSSKDKANLFAVKFSALGDTLHNLPDISLQMEQEIFFMRMTANNL